MSYRIYDKQKEKWIKDGIYLTQNGDLFKTDKSIFGRVKLSPIYSERYVLHNFIDLYDKNNEPIYVGDYLEAVVAEDRVVRGIVTYAIELSAYIILCFSVDEYFTLGSDICKYIKKIGNVFDGFNDEERENQ